MKNMTDDLPNILEKYATDGSKKEISLDGLIMVKGIPCTFGFWMDKDMFVAIPVGKMPGIGNLIIGTIEEVEEPTPLMKAIC
jgi:hypothetical protein